MNDKETTLSRFADSSAGKAEAEIQRISHTGGADIHGGEIIHVTTRKEIESGDLSRFLTMFGPRVPRGLLRWRFGRVRFTVSGYEGEPQPLYEIPAVRKYYSLAHRCWPCWLAFGNPHSDCLKVIAHSIVPHLVLIRRKDCEWHEVSVRIKDLGDFFHDSLMPAAFVHSRTGLSKEQGAERLRAMSHYLGISEA